MDSKPTLRRRTAGIFKSRLPDLNIDEIDDPRESKGLKWQQSQLVNAALAGLMSGSKSTADTEDLTDEMSPAMREVLDIPRRVPDTTQRDWLCRPDPERFRSLIHDTIRAAGDRDALGSESLPFNVGSMDGKTQVLGGWDPKYAQHHHNEDNGAEHGELRTITTCLVTARGRPCLDAFPVPADTNEMGVFKAAFSELMRLYRRRLDVVMYDAGAGSEENADTVIDEGLDYVFHLKDERRLMFKQAFDELGRLEEPAAQTVDWLSKDPTKTAGTGKKKQRRPKRERESKNKAVSSRRKKTASVAKKVVRKLFICENKGTPKDLLVWRHTKTLLRIRSETYENDKLVASEDRYFNTSISRDRLTDDQWLLLIRLHWSVENNCHHTYDKAFEEDKRPWVRDDPYGALAITFLRRVAYNLWTFFRSVTQRSKKQRATPWKTLMRRMYKTCIKVTEQEIEGLRKRKASVASS